MKILVPMAGLDSYFKPEDHPFPKPLIEISGRPMVEWVVDNLKLLNPDADFIFICRDEHVHRFGLEQIFSHLTNGRSQVVALKSDTSGAICSCLMAAHLIDPDDELVIANGDQIVEAGLDKLSEWAHRKGLDAAVLTFDSIHPRWSYVTVGDEGLVLEAAEKRVISRNATAGIYYFTKGSTFIEIARSALLNDNSVDGHFYIAPALNHIILKAGRIGALPIDSKHYHSLFAPYKVEEFETILRQREIKSFASEGAGLAKSAVSVVPTVVIPAAGEGSRFVAAGFDKPKPFIDVQGAPMVSRVMDNLHYPKANYVMLLRQEHAARNEDIVKWIEDNYPASIVPVARLTEGTVCTVLLGRTKIDPDAPLIIANSDQIVDFDFTHFVDDCIARDLDGSILVFRDAQRDTKWSFARINDAGLVEEVKEKVAISDLATVGIYMFRNARTFFDAAIDMIAANDRVNNEFYTCPVYNYAIANGKRIGVLEVSASAMHGIGTPDDLAAYLAAV